MTPVASMASAKRKSQMSTTNIKNLNVGTLNVQGCREKIKQQCIIEDMAKYDLQILALTETHILEEDVSSVVAKHGSTERRYKVYHGGIQGKNKHTGTGFVIEESLNPRFKRVTDRISTVSFLLNKDHFVNIIAAYAPTQTKSEENPQVCENFYNELDRLTSVHKKDKHLLLILGDFNAKTGSGYRRYPENMGRFGKGLLNSNGEHLLDFAKENDLVLTNTLFQHKFAHRTTWTSLERILPHLAFDGTIRRNPYRNQIDYIITKQLHKSLFQDSRSYSGISTSTDHKLVKAVIKLDWWRMKNQKSKSKKIDTSKLCEEPFRQQFSERLKEKIAETDMLDEKPNESWKIIANACKETAKEVLGVKDRNKKPSITDEIKQLSNMQKKLRDDAEAANDKTTRRKLKDKRNKTLKEIKHRLKEEQTVTLNKEMQEIENNKNNTNKYYQAIRVINSKKPRKPLRIYDNDFNLVSSEKDQITIITKFYKDLFHSEDSPPPVPPVRMDPPFTSEEISKSARKLKNNKATGIDDVHAEYIKYGPNELHTEISNILNKTSETGEHPEVLRQGILNPLAKPAKKNEKVNVRPIILLSALRKILTIALIDRCWERMKHHIPLSQAAYQSGRSTTEQVFTIKIMTEKAITSENYDIFLLLLDMSKAFDTVNRTKLMKILETILTPCELFMMHILINDVVLNVRIGDKFGPDIHTSIGICQGDCLSALLFILFLAHAVKPIPNAIKEEDYTKHLWSTLDWIIDRDTHKIQIDPKYADDISFLRSDESKIKQIERVMPVMLADEGLHVNKSKTERYHISIDNNDESWRRCKYLGSVLDTNEDIKRRQCLAIDAMKTMEKTFESRYIRENTKIRIFKTYVESVFLYNSELWTLTKNLENKVDTFQRKLLRKAIHISWPRLISNEQLYERTNVPTWSSTILKRKMSWFGHLMRLSPETPARVALENFVKPVKRPIGRPKTTWLDITMKELKNMTNIPLTKDNAANLKHLETLCSDRKLWRKVVDSMMLMKLTNVQ